VARDDPSDPRPRALAHALSVLTGLPAGTLRRGDDCLAADDPAQVLALVDERVVAAAVGGAPFAVAEDGGGSSSESNIIILRSAAKRTSVGLAATLRDEEMPAPKRLQLDALHAFLHMGVESVLKTPISVAVAESKEGEDEDDGKEAA
jgi:hypothetical protein